uniref:F-box family protein n=1 Tax=Pithovirus LCPAC304 TaxID=2506594 RepID=A0A481Z8Z3_9VIRU|nr:MAG: F-box family protein [Pithovirus LCPAC304]
MQSETNVEGLLTLPPEMCEEILLSLPLQDLLNVCSTCKKLHHFLYENDAFWRRKTHAEFPKTENRVSPSIEDTWKEEYKTLSRPSLSIQEMIERMEKIDGRWWMYYRGDRGGYDDNGQKWTYHGPDRGKFINTATYEKLKDKLLNEYRVNFTVWDEEGTVDEILSDVEVVGDALADRLLDRHILVSGRASNRLIADKEIWTLEYYEDNYE